MDTDRIVLIDLSKARLAKSAARLLGYLHLNRSWTAWLHWHRYAPANLRR